MLGHDLKIEFVEIEKADKALPAESFVSGPGTWYWHATAGQKSCRRLADHRIEPHAVGAEFTHVKCLAARKKGAIGIAAIRYVRKARRRTDYCSRKSRAVVRRVPHPFHPDLVITHSAKDVSVCGKDSAGRVHRRRTEMVEVEAPAITRQRHHSLFRNNIVEFELTKLEVQPGAMEQVVQPHVHRFHMKGTGLVGRGYQEERNILVQRASGQDVEPGVIKSCECQLAEGGADGRLVIGDLVCAFAMPEGRDA